MIGKKFKIKGGLLSDIVSPEELEKMTITAEENKEEVKSTESEPKTENSENKDASWKSRVSEPATENTDDGNQGCKKASNQNEYADEIGLAEIDMDTPSASENIAADIVDGLEDAFEATDEIIEQKIIMDEAAAAGNLSVLSVAIFKENAERYMGKMHGEGKGTFDGKFIDPDNSGLQSDNPESLRAGMQGVWDSIVQTIQGVINSLDKAGFALENALANIGNEINMKISKVIVQGIWFPFKKKIESSLNENKDFIIKKGFADRYLGANYVAAHVKYGDKRVDSKGIVEFADEIIDYFTKDKLPELKETGEQVEVVPKSNRGELEKKLADFVLEKIKKGEDGKSIFREIFGAEDMLMIKGTAKLFGGNSVSGKGHNPNSIKAEQVDAYSMFTNRLYAIVFTADGKNYLHDFSISIPFNLVFGKEKNTQVDADLTISNKDFKFMMDKVESGLEDLKMLTRSIQKDKVSKINKILKDDIADLKNMISKGEFTNWKLWKQSRANLFSISKIYPQMIRISGMGLLNNVQFLAIMLASADAVNIKE